MIDFLSVNIEESINEIVEAMPVDMRNMLAVAETADVAEKIYNDWSDDCFVPHALRGHVWLHLDGIIIADEI